MNPAQLISLKRDGHALSGEQIRELVDAYVAGDLPDYQMSAFAMAVYFQGMSHQETLALTHSMLESGQSLSWGAHSRSKVDKHSTGGIGDKISIPLTPLLAYLGLDVPMISGRGLGATGGTLDKLESIPGFRTDLSIPETVDIVERVGCAITGASAEIAPADRKLYALRDVTGTVPSIPLITASILSKKLAETLDALVLDVKFGSGAFMKTIDDARKLANSLVQVANSAGTRTSALLTNMDRPLGRMVGNTVEVDEGIEVLQGNGPADVVELTVALAHELTSASKLDLGPDPKSRIREVLNGGAALEKFESMVEAQGGRLDERVSPAPRHTLVSKRAGVVQGFNSESIGWAVIELGGGRRQIGDRIDHATGVEVLVDTGQDIEAGQPLFNVFCDRGISDDVATILFQAINLGEERTTPAELIVDRASGQDD